MPTYLDASVLLRLWFQQPGCLALRDWKGPLLASSLTTAEVIRTLDRQRQLGRLGPDQYAAGCTFCAEILQVVATIDLTPAILAQVAAPLPSPLGTLDAIHLVSALRWREAMQAELVFATHHRELAAAARVHGLPVIGV